MPPHDREVKLKERLESRFSPTFLHISDEGHLHAGHVGAADGRGHFRVKIVSDAFSGLTPLARHRLVYAAVADLLETEIHALAIDALPPLER
jgi:BolA protein